VRLKGEGKLVCRGKVLAKEGAVTAVRGRALGLKVCWGKQQQRRKVGGCVTEGGKMSKTVEAGQGILVLAREKEKRARWGFG